MRDSTITIRISKKNRKELLFGLLFVVPYIEPFVGGTWRIGNNAVGRAIIIIECCIILINLVSSFILKRKRGISHATELLFCIYILLMLFFNTELRVFNISTTLWMVIPVLCAMTIHSRMAYEHIDYNKVIYYGVYAFMAYAIALVLYNMMFLGLLANSHRLIALAGGPVIFGYTLAVFFALVITNKEVFSNREALVFQIAFTAFAVLTGSRGGVWPIVMLWFIDFLKSKFSYKRLLGVTILIVVFIVVNPIDYIYHFMPRLFENTDTSRLSSTLGAIEAFSSFSPLQKMVGYGPGECFPYQAWVNRNVANSSIMVNSNLFIFKGVPMLVQPHNSFIYYALELGIVGIGIMGLAIIKNLKPLRTDRRINRLVFIGTVLFVNLFDSVFIVEPGVSMVMWLMIMMSSSQRTTKKNAI